MANEYQQVVVPLRGGIDLVSPRYSVTPGTLQDDMNYETFSVSGYSVMEGLCRYDGTYPCYPRDWVQATRLSGSGTFLRGNYLKNGANYFGVTLAWDSTNGVLSYLILNQSAAPKVGDTISDPAQSATLVADIGGIVRASRFYTDESSFLTAQNTIYEAARNSKVGPFPFVSYARNITPHGLHWYKGRLYAIADNYQISFGTGAKEVVPGDKIMMLGSPGAIVLSVTVTSGAWSSSNAAGTMVIRFLPGFTPALLSLASTDVQRPNGATGTTTLSGAFVTTDKQVPSSPTAGLFFGPYDDDYQTAKQINDTATNQVNFGQAWTAADMGWEAQFKTNNTTVGNAPSTVFRGQFASNLLSATISIASVATAEVLDATASTLHPLAGISATQPASTALHTVLGDANVATYVTPGTATGPSDITTAYAVIDAFNFASIPDAAIITGIEVTGTFFTGAHTTANWNFILSGTQLAGQTPSTKTAAVGTGVVNVAQILGGDGDLWGLTLSAPNLLSAIRNDPTFGLKFNAHQTIASATENSRLTDVSLKIYYKTPITAYYAHDPVSGQDLQIGIPFYRLLSGQFNPGATQSLWGTGSMSIYNVTPLDTDGTAPNSTTWTIGTNWELRDARHGTGSLIAIFTNQMTAATLPTRASMESVRKRFAPNSIVTANFYANADWKAFYGVSGVGPAFQYDGYYFYNIYTQLPITEDIPSSIAYHRNYNVLGFDNGTALVSFPGQPTNFDPVAGSTQYAFGDTITNLMSLNGTALAVMCESSIHALTGDVLTATDDNNAVQQVISPYSGAFPYSAVDAGVPQFMDFRGISTIDATNKYGDFENGRVSFQITPYLVDRVNDRFAFQSTSQDFLFALPVRNKNQVRYYFSDAQILTCGLPVGDRGYEFTKQRYSDSTNLDALVPVCIAAGTTKSGRDLLFGTFRIRPDSNTTIVTPSAPERETYVYSLDKGTRFDLAPIKHFVRLNFMDLDSQSITFDTARNCRIELLTQNYFNGYTNVAGDLQPFNATQRPLSIDPTGKSVRVTRDSDYITAQLEGRGTTIAIEIGGEHIYPGHVLQSLVVSYKTGKQQFGNSPTQTLK